MDKKTPETVRESLQLEIIKIVDEWPKLRRILETGDIDGHPQNFIDDLTDACMKHFSRAEVQ